MGGLPSAARQDYAEAAAAVLVSGDNQAGKGVEYQDMPEEDYRKILIDAGLPESLAVLLADSDTGASKGALFDDSQSLLNQCGYFIAGRNRTCPPHKNWRERKDSHRTAISYFSIVKLPSAR